MSQQILQDKSIITKGASMKTTQSIYEKLTKFNLITQRNLLNSLEIVMAKNIVVLINLQLSLGF